MARSSFDADALLLYFFYGMYYWKTTRKKKKDQPKDMPAEMTLREKPFVFYLHKKMINGRARFAKDVRLHFAKFLAEYKRNEAEWKPFFTDNGAGTPPVEFNIFIEDGLRTCAINDRYLMGSHALRYLPLYPPPTIFNLIRHTQTHTGLACIGPPRFKFGERWKTSSPWAGSAFSAFTRMKRVQNYWNTKSGTISASRITACVNNWYVRSACVIFLFLMARMKRILKENTNLTGTNTRSRRESRLSPNLPKTKPLKRPRQHRQRDRLVLQ